jgi:hypothetical protein
MHYAYSASSFIFLNAIRPSKALISLPVEVCRLWDTPSHMKTLVKKSAEVALEVVDHITMATTEALMVPEGLCNNERP